MPGSTVTEFNALMFRNWTSGEWLAAEQREIHAASDHLTYLRWLRDVTLP